MRSRDPRDARARDGDRAASTTRSPAEAPLGRLPASRSARAVPEPPVAARVAGRRACPEPDRRLGGPVAALDKGGRGRRWRPAGCGSWSTSTTWCRRWAVTPAAAARDGASARERRASRTPPACSWTGHGRCASSLDLRGARVEEALEALARYLDDASLAGLDTVTIIHGLGTGALRDAVRARPAAIRWSAAVRPGERGEGGDGATIVEL